MWHACACMCVCVRARVHELSAEVARTTWGLKGRPRLAWVRGGCGSEGHAPSFFPFPPSCRLVMEVYQKQLHSQTGAFPPQKKKKNLQTKYLSVKGLSMRQAPQLPNPNRLRLRGPLFLSSPCLVSWGQRFLQGSLHLLFLGLGGLLSPLRRPHCGRPIAVPAPWS